MTTKTAKTPTLEEFKKWSRDCEPAARAVLMARVFADMERERVAAYIEPLFRSYHFEIDPKWRERGIEPTIKTSHDLYLADLDDPLVAAFYADCDKAHRDHGFTGPAGHCPALRAESLVRETERALMDLADPLFGIGSDLYGDNRAKYLELLIGACFARDRAEVSA
jgi:hypothetical protein